MRQLTLAQYESFLASEAKYRPTEEEKKLAYAYSAACKSKAERPISIERRECTLHKKAANKVREYRRYSSFERYLKELDRAAIRQRKSQQKRTDWITPFAIKEEVDEVRVYWMRRLFSIQKRSFNCSLTVEDLLLLHENTPVCPVFGTPLLRDKDTQVDQIKPGEGYHVGNVQLLSALANRIKSNATAEQVQAVASFMQKQ